MTRLRASVTWGSSSTKSTLGCMVRGSPVCLSIGARAEIYRLIRQFCDRGYCLIMASSDIEEVLGMSDIIVSMYRGRQIRAYRRGEAGLHRVLADITHPVAAT